MRHPASFPEIIYKPYSPIGVDQRYVVSNQQNEQTYSFVLQPHQMRAMHKEKAFLMISSINNFKFSQNSKLEITTKFHEMVYEL